MRLLRQYVVAGIMCHRHNTDRRLRAHRKCRATHSLLRYDSVRSGLCGARRVVLHAYAPHVSTTTHRANMRHGARSARTTRTRRQHTRRSTVAGKAVGVANYIFVNTVSVTFGGHRYRSTGSGGNLHRVGGVEKDTNDRSAQVTAHALAPTMLQAKKGRVM